MFKKYECVEGKGVQYLYIGGQVIYREKINGLNVQMNIGDRVSELLARQDGWDMVWLGKRRLREL